MRLPERKKVRMRHNRIWTLEKMTMKIPLRYQMTEYDCGPTSLLNAMSFLFDREQLPPDLVRSIMVYSLDSFNNEGGAGKGGTSRMAMMFLSHYLEEYGKAGRLPVAAEYISRENVTVGSSSRINSVLRRGGAAVVRLFFDEEHYVLFTGDRDDRICLFDPYFCDLAETGLDPVIDGRITVDEDHPCEYNRIVSYDVFNHETCDIYSLGEMKGREAVLLFNKDKMLPEEGQVEYFI